MNYVKYLIASSMRILRVHLIKNFIESAQLCSPPLHLCLLRLGVYRNSVRCSMTDAATATLEDIFANTATPAEEIIDL